MGETFRKLRADEIECRVKNVTKFGVMLLLYKDARCDQNILDETFGAMNWQRHHSRDNANCIVSIWDDSKKMWVEKEDTGTESNTEKEKGLASDSFKRACFNWGIGRELYTAPDIWFSAKNCNISDGKCYDRFYVSAIEYADDGKISAVEVTNNKTGKTERFENLELDNGEDRARVLKFINDNEEPSAVLDFFVKEYGCKPQNAEKEVLKHFIKRMQNNGREI